MSPPMVSAIQREIENPGSGKTITRRIINPQPPENVTSAGVISRSSEGQTDEWSWLSGNPQDIDDCYFEEDFKTGYRPGDRLYLREHYFQEGFWDKVGKTKTGKDKWLFRPANSDIVFSPPPIFLASRDKGREYRVQWYKRLGRFMPRKLSRLTLDVREVRVERLQEITEKDAIAEGLIWRDHLEAWTAIDDPCWPTFTDATRSYQGLWNALHGEGKQWADNPWVTVIVFDPIAQNVDKISDR